MFAMTFVSTLSYREMVAQILGFPAQDFAVAFRSLLLCKVFGNVE
jgi:5,10-methenyltetrahydromethanopterin hydrogenase